MKTKFLVLLSALMIFSFFAKSSYSQDKSGNLIEMNFLTFDYDKMQDFMKFYEEYGKPLDAQNEYILATKILRHFSGPSWNLCFVTVYKDLESMSKAQKRGDELFEKVYTDKSKQEEVMKKWMSYLRGHTDALVTDNPGLEKK